MDFLVFNILDQNDRSMLMCSTKILWLIISFILRIEHHGFSKIVFFWPTLTNIHPVRAQSYELSGRQHGAGRRTVAIAIQLRWYAEYGFHPSRQGFFQECTYNTAKWQTATSSCTNRNVTMCRNGGIPGQLMHDGSPRAMGGESRTWLCFAHNSFGNAANTNQSPVRLRCQRLPAEGLIDVAKFGLQYCVLCTFQLLVIANKYPVDVLCQKNAKDAITTRHRKDPKSL